MSRSSDRCAPLRGKRVLVTRAAEQAGPLGEALQREGAVPTVIPLLAIRPAGEDVLDSAIAAAEGAAWVICTSANGVRVIGERAKGTRRLAALRTTPLAVVGAATAAAAVPFGWPVSFVPATSTAERLAEELPAVFGRQLVLFQAATARPELVGGLQHRGGHVTSFTVYTTVPATPLTPATRAALRKWEYDCVTLTSGVALGYLIAALRNCGFPQPEALLARTVVACIGPVTAQAATDRGITPAVVSRDATVASLVAALRVHYGRSAQEAIT